MPIKPIVLPEFNGGWSTRDQSLIDDNQGALFTNYYYRPDRLPSTRLGTLSFGEAIPASAIQISNMDSFNGNGTWNASSDATNVTTDTTNQKRGAGCVNFDIDVSASVNNNAFISNSTLAAVDLSAANQTGDIRLWFNMPDTTNLTSFTVRWGSDATNYYEKTETTQAGGTAFVDGWNYLSFDWSAATTTGSPVDSAIDYVLVQVNYTSSQADETDVLVDSIYWVSASEADTTLSLNAYKVSTGTQYMLAHAGTVYWLYDETTTRWEPIYTGMQEVAGDFAVYIDISYYVNGTDYLSFDGTTVAQEATPQKIKYLQVKNDIAYGAGVTGNLSTLYYSNGNPASLKISYANNDPIEEDNGQNITGIANIGNLIYVGKEKSIYRYDVSSPAYDEIDSQIGMAANRAVVAVDRNLLFLGDDGHIYNASVLLEAGTRTQAIPLTDDLDTYMRSLKNLSVSAAFHWQRANHVYFAIDEDDSGVPNAMLVINTALSSFEQNRAVVTKYEGVNARDFTLWEDSDGVEHLLCANSFGGQVFEMETGTLDDSIEIKSTFKSKLFDFGDAMRFKQVNEMTGQVFASDGATFVLDVLSEGGVVKSKSIDTGSLQESGGAVLGINTLGTTTLASGGDADTLNSYIFRLPVYLTQRFVQFQIRDVGSGQTVIPYKMTINAKELNFHFFPNSNYV